MGTRISVLAGRDDRFENIQTTWPPTRSADVIIDFSVDQGARRAAQHAAQTGAALLVGTTGLSPETLDVIGDTARLVPVVVAANTSRGMVFIARLIEQAGRSLGDRVDVDVIERHHAGKRDAPSGTALQLVDAWVRGGGCQIAKDRIHSVRAGKIVGEHIFEIVGQGERIRIEHQVGDRDIFALGALDAAAWLAGREPGQYPIEQALGLVP